LDGQGADEILGGYIKYSKWYLQEIIRTKGLKTANKEAKDLSNNHFLNKWGFKEKLSAYTPSVTKFLLERKAKHILKKDPWLTQDFKREFDVSDYIFKPEVSKLNDILYADTMVYGLEELLRYADRNSMAHGCEVRLPFLDHKLVEFIFSIPATLKFKNGWNKWILRNFINGNLPDTIVWQKGKIGFETPQEQWLNDSRMKEKIMEGRRLMIQEGIYKKEVLNTPFKIASVHDANNFDWRCISASTLLS
ncbi:MAG: asparagine synthase-related protein, partial [Chitinophagaceae bacterium]